jgi:hypothetical protein
MDVHTRAFCTELLELMVRHDVSFGVDIEGDTHGLHYVFGVDVGKISTELNPGYAYLDVSDLKIALTEHI